MQTVLESGGVYQSSVWFRREARLTINRRSEEAWPVKSTEHVGKNEIMK